VWESLVHGDSVTKRPKRAPIKSLADRKRAFKAEKSPTDTCLLQENTALKARLESLNWLAQQEADRAAVAQGRVLTSAEELSQVVVCVCVGGG